MIDKKQYDKHVFIHMKDEPVVYGNLTLLLYENGLNRNHFFGKQFPVMVNGYPVYKKKLNRGTVAKSILKTIVLETKNHKEFGEFLYDIQDEFLNKIKLGFKYSGGFFNVKLFKCYNQEGEVYDTPLNLKRIEKALNG